MPTKEELEKENAELKAQLEALQPGGLVCVVSGEPLVEARYYIRHPDFPDGAPVVVCYDVFEKATQAGCWSMDMSEESDDRLPVPTEVVEEEPEEEEGE